MFACTPMHTAQYQPLWNCSPPVTDTYSSVSASMELFSTDHRHIQLSISLHGTVLQRSQTHTAQYQSLWNCSTPIINTYSSVSASMELFCTGHRHIQLSISLYGTVLHRSQAHTAQYQPLWNCSPPVTGTYSSVSASMKLFSTGHRHIQLSISLYGTVLHRSQNTYSSVSASMELFSTGHRHIQLSISLYETVLHRSQAHTAQYQPLWNCSAPITKHIQLSISLYGTVLHRSKNTNSSVSASMELFGTGQKTQTAQYKPL